MKRFLIFISFAALLAACDKDDCNDGTVPDSNQISINAIMENITPQTRTTDDGTNASWVTSDVVGLFCAQSNPAASNLQFTYNGTAWTPASSIFWHDFSTVHKFYAYAPYAGGNTVTAVAIPVINSQTGTINPAHNLLFSNNLDAGINKGSNSGSAPLIFKHALSLVQLNITIDNSVPSGTKLTSAVISGQAADAIATTAAGATLNVVTGAITGGSATGNVITVQPASAPTLSSTAVTLNVLLLPSTSTPSLVINSLFPDTTTGNASVAMGSNLTFVQATKYTYTVTVSRSAITITNMTITPWTSSGPPTSISPIL